VLSTRLNMVNLQSDDPFVILDLDPSPTLDKKQIKRAYKRMALKYHPDMTTTIESTPEEKKKSNDNFAKINWAYEQLSSGKGRTGSSTSDTSTSSRSTGTGYEAPHRRKSAYKENSSSSTDWRDYMPKDDGEDYDTNGDSFGKIFTDLVGGAVAGSGSGGNGIFRDFVDFLERNVDGYSSSSTDDAELTTLLRTGTLEEVANEMDDTDLVVQQLSTKAEKIRDEILDLQADRKVALRYIEKIDIDEKIAESEARQKVVADYVKQARKRLASLQARYKELIVSGENDTNFSGRSSSASNDYGSSSSAGDDSSSSETSSSRRSSSNGNKEDAWKYEGFGSTGRRGSSRRRRSGSNRGGSSSAESNRGGSNSAESNRSSTRQSSTRQSSTYQPREDVFEQSKSRSSNQKSNYDTSPRAPPGYEDRKAKTTYTSSSEPPHRRIRSSSPLSDKRRLNEIKVDEEFEKLKKDLGL